MTTVQDQKAKGQGHKVTYQQQRCNSATDSRINFKLGGNYHRRWLMMRHAVYVSRSNKPEVDIWPTFSLSGEKKSTENFLRSLKFCYYEEIGVK